MAWQKQFPLKCTSKKVNNLNLSWHFRVSAQGYFLLCLGASSFTYAWDCYFLGWTTHHGVEAEREHMWEQLLDNIHTPCVFCPLPFISLPPVIVTSSSCGSWWSWTGTYLLHMLQKHLLNWVDSVFHRQLHWCPSSLETSTSSDLGGQLF